MDILDFVDLGWKHLLSVVRAFSFACLSLLVGTSLALSISCSAGVETTYGVGPQETTKIISAPAEAGDLTLIANRIAATVLTGDIDSFIQAFTDDCQVNLLADNSWFEPTREMNRTLGTGEIPVSTVIGKSPSRGGWEVQTWYASSVDAPSGTSSVGGRETTIWVVTAGGWRRNDCNDVRKAADHFRNKSGLTTDTSTE